MVKSINIVGKNFLVGALMLMVMFPAAALAGGNPNAETKEAKAITLPGFFDDFAVGLSGGAALFQGDVAAYDRLPSFSEFNDSREFAWGVTVSKGFNYGLGLQFQYRTGDLQGTRGQLLDPKTIIVFNGEFQDFSLNGSYDLTKLLTKKEKRYSFNGTLGIGAIWFRAQAIKVSSSRRIGAVGYKPVDDTDSQILLEKDKAVQKTIIPVGLDFVYRLNYKADITLSMVLVNTNTDQLDAYVRDWTANDKYSYLGIGLRYNFNRSEADDPSSEEEDAYDADSAGDDKSSSKSSGGGGIFNRSGSKKSKKKSGSSQESDELLQLRLKLYETQLKLFEMQYLLDNK